jgi:ATP adenylyltransferase
MSETVCPLCEELGLQEHVLKRWDNFVLIFNRYPYAAGHLMVISQDHIGTLNKLTSAQRAELIDAINETEQVLFKALNIESTNIGINHGVWSGASIPEHLHVHIVPRYPNDIGFSELLFRMVPDRNIKINRAIKKAFEPLIEADHGGMR